MLFLYLTASSQQIEVIRRPYVFMWSLKLKAPKPPTSRNGRHCEQSSGSTRRYRVSCHHIIHCFRHESCGDGPEWRLTN